MNETIESLKVGEKYSKWQTNQDTYIMEYGDSGFTLYAMLDKPSDHEKSQFQSITDFCLRYCVINDICMFCFKFGDIPWSDCPFSPAIYKEVGRTVNFPNLSDSEGFSLTVLLIDTNSGELCNIRFIGLEHNMSCNLREWLIDAAKRDLSKKEYITRIEKIYHDYSSVDLAAKGERNNFLLLPPKK